MVNYILNGVELPAFPIVNTSTHPHAIVLDITALKTDDLNYDYVVFFSSDEFVYGTCSLDGVVVQTILHPSDALIIPYACTKTSISWESVSITTDEGNYTHTAVPTDSKFQWTSHNIVNLDTGDVQYEKTEIQQHVFADTPYISPNLDNSKEYIYFQEDCATMLNINAASYDSSSGGVLSYQWYVIEDGVSKSIDGACNNFYFPSTSKLGIYKYYCVVTNTYEEYTATQSSNVVTVIVRSVDSIIPKKTKFDHQSASLGWIIGKLLQYIVSMDSEADDATLINGVLYLFNGKATLTNNSLEVR